MSDDFWGEPVSVYTREQAIADGVLVDVTPWAAEEGFVVPTVFTQALWSDVQQTGDGDVRGRAHDVLFLASFAARLRPGQDLVEFNCHLAGDLRRLRAVVDGDGITIGYPEDF